MRTILQIIESAKDGNHIEKAESYWCMLALDILLADEQQSLSTVVQAVSEGKKAFKTAVKEQQESFKRLTIAANMEPQKLVESIGRSPVDAGYQERRKALKEKFNVKAPVQKAVDGEARLN